MSLATDVQDQIRRFVVGRVSADDLSDWLDVLAQEIHDADDTDLRRLTDTTFSLLEDTLQEQRSEDACRVALNTLITPDIGQLRSPGTTATSFRGRRRRT